MHLPLVYRESPSTVSLGFPMLPTLLSSANNVVTLRLEGASAIGYVSPEALAIGLATLTRLETLHIGFTPSSHPDQTRRPQEMRAILAVLTSFKFRGDCEYLENFVFRIDVPQLNRVDIDFVPFFLIDFPVAGLVKFVNRSDSLQPTPLRLVKYRFQNVSASIVLNLPIPRLPSILQS